ncbi:MAG: hypothetical protein LUC45_00480 [Paraprevotella sp.]|nr:hypothetical protein [Paraprevotella sp.]
MNGSVAENRTLDITSLTVGPHFSYPLSSYWRIGCKLLTGYLHYPSLPLTDLTTPSRNGICFGCGTSLTFLTYKDFDVRFFLDYDLVPPPKSASGEYMSMLTAGASFAVSF